MKNTEGFDRFDALNANYDKQPVIEVADGAGACAAGWRAVVGRLKEAVEAAPSPGDRAFVMSIECYTGVFEDEIAEALQALHPVRIVRSGQAFFSDELIEQKLAPFNGGEDPVFGRMNELTMDELLDPQRVEALAAEIGRIEAGLVIVLGNGASRLHPGDLLVYADLARWEAQQRMRRDAISNLGVENRCLKWSLQYKRAYFTDWRICDRLKRELMAHWDFVLDTNQPGEPKKKMPGKK